MSPVPSYANHTITVVEPGSRTVHGSPVLDWSPSKVTTREISGCLVTAKSTAESDTPDTVRAGWDILLPPEASPPATTAKVRHPLAAGDYQIIGEVLPVPGISEPVDHWFMYCERWKTSG
ncbi:head-to-tail stopper [Arthrobacter phage Shambre1]|uniref:Head-to-tail stopper n=1 Tax=Arthrobacter phage Shambre1 TaxID=2927284 RepID=A0A977KPM4_9CAUD|nr:head-to-tail stopper [Arthrobacter phage Shambre1]UXE04747.1 head-to-tail stopper [Arthrobacter phage Shambre1]